MNTLQEVSRGKKSHLFGFNRKGFMNVMSFEPYHERWFGRQKKMKTTKTGQGKALQMEGIAWVRMYACKAVEYVFNLVNDTDSLGH